MRAIKHIFIIISFLAIIFQGCVYDFNPDLHKYDDLLVVYGGITNDYGPHEIKLARSTKLDGYSSPAVNGATVTIQDDRGNTIPLTAKENGSYFTPYDFKGEIGVKYKIAIALKGGDHYESDFVELTAVPEISNLSAELKKKDETQTTSEAYGYQFYVDANASDSKQKYLRWEMEETWEIEMPYNINKYWNGDTMIDVSFPKRCWRESKVADIFIANSNEYQANNIKKFPLNFTTNESERLKIKYSLLVKQYALTEKSFYFWQGQLNNNQQQGSLFDKQPYQVVGNIKNIDHPSEVVLGIFEASAVTKKRIFVERPNVAIPTGFEFCEKTPMSKLTEDQWYRSFFASVTVVESYVVFDKRCVDCTETGSTPVMPDYWK